MIKAIISFVKFSLKHKEKVLFKNSNIQFNSGKINHLLGSNGVSKLPLAKSCYGLLKYDGQINYSEKILLSAAILMFLKHLKS
ncbi:MAG: hypothetical protein ACK5NF_01055 [Bacilli bacterium]